MGHLPSFCMVLCFLLLYVLFMIRKIIFKKDVSSQGLGDKNMSLCSLKGAEHSESYWVRGVLREGSLCERSLGTYRVPVAIGEQSHLLGFLGFSQDQE